MARTFRAGQFAKGLPELTGMTNPNAIVRSLLIWVLIVPVGLLLGYTLPDLTTFDINAMVVFGLAVFVMTLPLLMKYHHPWLLLSWNMSAVIFVLPGRPYLWMAMTGISLVIGVLQHTINPEKRFISVPSLTQPLIALGLLVLIIAKLTGGLGLASMGSELYGGKRYVWIWAAILGFFAISSREIPREKAMLYVALFFLGGVTMAIGNLFGVLGQSLSWLFLIFPAETLVDTESGDGFMMRSWALPFMSIAVYSAMMSKYGLRGCFDFRHPWRVLVLTFFMLVGMMGGFRTMLVILALTTALLFYMEGLMRSRFLPAVILCMVLGISLIAVFANQLPLSIQRTLAVLPLDIDPVVRLNAEASSEWRIQMWRDLLPEIPEHLILGKGYGFTASDINVVYAKIQSLSRTAGAELVGDYHNGPLSVILPLGLPGTLVFLWFVYASMRAMYLNYKYGAPELKQINRFLLAFYSARMIFFFAVFGSLYSDLAMFTGILGLSVSLNGGIARRVAEPVLEPVEEKFKFNPGERRTVNA
jgi:hypothetical protein